jgi:hypothetical protein
MLPGIRFWFEEKRIGRKMMRSYGANGFAPLFIIFHVQHVPGF